MKNQTKQEKSENYKTIVSGGLRSINNENNLCTYFTKSFRVVGSFSSRRSGTIANEPDVQTGTTSAFWIQHHNTQHVTSSIKHFTSQHNTAQ
jgi:hypothetical protein